MATISTLMIFKCVFSPNGCKIKPTEFPVLNLNKHSFSKCHLKITAENMITKTKNLLRNLVASKYKTQRQ